MSSLALFFTYGISLEDWEKNGSLDREVAIFRRLLTYYDTVYLVTYGKNDLKLMSELPTGITVLPKAYQIPDFAYSFLIPIVYRKHFRNVSVIKTNQVLGSWSAVLAKRLFKKKLYVRSGYTISMHTAKITTAPRWANIILRGIEWWAYRHADASSVTTEEQRDYLKDTYHKSDVTVIPNGVDTELFKPSHKPRGKVFELLFVGRLHPEKNVLNMVKALKGIADVRLTIIGKGPLEAELRRQIAKDNLNVDCIPMVPNHELPHYYQTADLYIQASLYEGNPKTILEAMSCGLPCLCSDVPGIKSLINHQENGYLCDTSIESIRNSLQYLLQSPRLCQHMGKQARYTVCSLHSINKVFNKELELHTALCQSNKPHPYLTYITGGDGVGWSLDKDQEALTEIFQKANIPTTRNPLTATHVFCTWYDGLFTIKYRWLLLITRFLGKKVIATISNDLSCNPEKVRRNDNKIAAYITPSAKMTSFLRSVTNKKVFTVPFYIDPEIFFRTTLERNEIAEQLHIDPKLIAGRYIIGSFQRDSLGVDLGKPKWQKKPDLLIDICSLLPSDSYILLLAGPRRHYIIKKCKELNIPYVYIGNHDAIDQFKDDIFINNLPSRTLNLLYNITDVYLITSSSEGGPKQAIESCLSKTLVFSTNVGLVPDFIHSNLLYDEATEVADKIRQYYKNPESFSVYIEENYHSATAKMNISHLARLYAKIVEETTQL